ncbi:transposase, partial [Streptomyces chartreusis]|uniref:transposase n=1 Tax=Streptomyces chartreusis TaxID=1969 RepID=UPI0038163432
MTTAANVNDITQTYTLVAELNAAGRPQAVPDIRAHHPDSLLGDKGYDSNPNHRDLQKRRILPVISPLPFWLPATGRPAFGVGMTFSPCRSHVLGG